MLRKKKKRTAKERKKPKQFKEVSQGIQGKKGRKSMKKGRKEVFNCEEKFSNANIILFTKNAKKWIEPREEEAEGGKK